MLLVTVEGVAAAGGEVDPAVGVAEVETDEETPVRNDMCRKLTVWGHELTCLDVRKELVHCHQRQVYKGCVCRKQLDTCARTPQPLYENRLMSHCSCVRLMYI